MNSTLSWLMGFLKGEEVTAERSLTEWFNLIALCRQLGLLAVLADKVDRSDVCPMVWKRISTHLISAKLQVTNQQKSVKWHMERLVANNPDGIHFLALKGAAYLFAGKSIAVGRTMSDVDILVTKSSLDNAEFWLFLNGYASINNDDYDDFYYRQWMHELPPFVNTTGGLTLDLHHNLLPITSKRFIEPQLLFDEASEIEPNFFIPCDADLIIHSAVHLLQDSVFNRTLRDLNDLYHLVEALVQRNKNSAKLIERAKTLKLEKDLAKVFALLQSVFERKLSTIESDFVKQCLGRSLVWRLEKCCYIKMLQQPILVEWTAKHHLSSWILFIKSHLIKMPLSLLIKHTYVKTVKNIKSVWESDETQK